MAVWKTVHEEVESEGNELFGDRFLSVSFERFCETPVNVFGQVYDKLPFEMSDMDFSVIHPARGAFDPGNRKWENLRKELGMVPS